MKKNLFCLALFLLAKTSFAQTDPQLYTWVRNLNSGTSYNGIASNVQSVYSSSTDVYVSCTCIPGYSIGPWSGNPNVAANQNFCFKITRTPVQNTGTATAVGNGHIGVWTNGVSIFNVSDAMSYNNAGIWFRNAYYWEGSGFDNCLGHPQQQGEYHHHVSPKCLYDITDSTHHSPIIGYAFDGYPVYGAYGYTNTNGTGAIKRMTPSYAVSSATTRVNGPAVSVTYPAGCFIQDYIYTAASGDLDARNGRFCVTPEYPLGTYCYFVTINSALTPIFPYTFYGTYYGVVQSGNTGPNSGHNTIPGSATQYTTAFTPSITISASATSICTGTQVTFTPTVTNGGTTPTYQWKKNNVNIATGSSYSSSSLANGDVITCVVTSDANYLTATTATSNSVTMIVSASVTPTCAITTSATTICSNTNATFSLTSTNGGSSTSYQWKKNGNNVGSNQSGYSDNALANGDVITCVMTSNETCVTSSTATSNSITMIVSASVTPTCAITTSATTICSSTNATFSLTSTNGGSSPSYQWKKNGNNVGSNQNGYSDNALADGDIISCVMTSNETCATSSTANSNSIAMTVNASATPSVSIAASATVICSGTNVTFTATPTNGGSSPAYQWKKNGVNVGTNSNIYSNSTLGNGKVITCVMTGNLSCATSSTATSNAVTMGVSSNVPSKPQAMTGTTNNLCNTSADYTYTIPTVNSATSYVWTLPANATLVSGQGTTTATINYSSLFVSGTVSVASVNACGTSAARTLNIYARTATPGAITGPTTVCANQQNVSYSIAAVTGATSYKWFVPTGSTITSGQNTSSIVVKFGTTAGDVSVYAKNSCANSTKSILPVTMNCRMGANNLLLTDENILKVTNPFTDKIILASDNDLNDASITLYDLTGREISQWENVSLIANEQQQLSVDKNMPIGIYLIAIKNSNVNFVSKINHQ